MSKSNSTQKTRMFNLLAKGNEVSIAEASRRLSIANPSAVVAALRDEGHVIWTNRRTAKNGDTVFVYRYDTQRSAANLR
jgi:NhaP-type Na+/H+ and K+/H+ antiporter